MVLKKILDELLKEFSRNFEENHRIISQVILEKEFKEVAERIEKKTLQQAFIASSVTEGFADLQKIF